MIAGPEDFVFFSLLINWCLPGHSPLCYKKPKGHKEAIWTDKEKLSPATQAQLPASTTNWYVKLYSNFGYLSSNLQIEAIVYYIMQSKSTQHPRQHSIMHTFKSQIIVRYQALRRNKEWFLRQGVTKQMPTTFEFGSPHQLIQR